MFSLNHLLSLPRWILLLSTTFAILPAQVAPGRGVVVEQVSEVSEPAKSGIQAGDVIDAWSTDTARGDIESPFDLAEVALEYAPRGRVILHGRRGGKEQTWTVAATTPFWTIAAHPLLPPKLLTLYQEGLRLAETGHRLEAANQWRATATQVDPSGPPWLAAWFLFRAAQLIEKTRQWSDIDAFNQLALDNAASAAPYVRAQILESWASTFYERELAKAELYLEQSLVERRKTGAENLRVALVTYTLGFAQRRRGEPAKAEPYYREALAIAEKVAPGTLAVAYHLNNLGSLAHARNQLILAEECFHRALVIRQKLAPDTTYTLLSNLGSLALLEDDLAKAEDYYRQALTLLRSLDPGNKNISVILGNLAVYAGRRGDLAGAEEYGRQSLDYVRKANPDSLDEAACQERLGSIAVWRGNLSSAGEFHLRALELRTRLAPESLLVARSYTALGGLAGTRGDTVKAEQYYRLALAIHEKLATGGEDHAGSLLHVAAVLRSKGELAESSKLFASGLNMLEHAAASENRDEPLPEFRARFIPDYRDFVEVLVAQNEPALAFHALERSRSRALLAMFAERSLSLDSDLPQNIRKERAANNTAYDRIQEQVISLSPAKDGAKIDTLLARLRALAVERENIAERIRRTSPRFAALRYPEPLDAAGTRKILDRGTVLLSYSVGPDRTTLFLVRPEGVEPGLTVHTLNIGEKALQSQAEAFRRLIAERTPSRRAELNKLSRGLYDLLLKPVEDQLAASERLLIAPDGPLHGVPFAALLRNDDRFLIEWKPVHTVISATVYAELRKLRQPDNKTDIDLLAFGDPRYPGPNPRLPQPVERGLDMGRLPFSRDEVSGISGLFPKTSQVYLQDQATEERAKALLPKARIIHFATHAILDERLPLDSALVLSIPEKRVDGQDNGLLQAWEILEQIRLNADLVVLSACQTGIGKELRGEGLIGLTRAFQYAGARSVIASLWSVDDRKTADLMKRFYGHLRAGKGKDEALRAAQSELIRSTASHPFYWAAFTLIGDWQ